MHAYLAAICRDLGAEGLQVGGVADADRARFCRAVRNFNHECTRMDTNHGRNYGFETRSAPASLRGFTFCVAAPSSSARGYHG